MTKGHNATLCVMAVTLSATMAGLITARDSQETAAEALGEFGCGCVEEAFGTGACCLQDGTCEDGLTLEECVEAGGCYQDDDTTCDQVGCSFGACCLPDGTCVDALEFVCCGLAENQAWLGEETSCSTSECPDFGACCLPDDQCEIDVEAACIRRDGTWQGPDTTCVDSNGNGIPDECEPIVTCRSDSNNDGVVDFIDLITLLRDWGPCSE